MKNKKLNYFLLLAVVIIWGVLIYQVIESVNTGDDTVAVTSTIIKKEKFNDYEVPRDTFRLRLNYRDPFGLVKFKDTVKAFAHERTTRTPIASVPVINWAFIRYSGYIRNPGSKQLVAIVQINGKTADMKEGEVVDKVKLIKNMQDSVKVLFNGKIKFIAIQRG